MFEPSASNITLPHCVWYIKIYPYIVKTVSPSPCVYVHKIRIKIHQKNIVFLFFFFTVELSAHRNETFCILNSSG